MLPERDSSKLGREVVGGGDKDDDDDDEDETEIDEEKEEGDEVNDDVYHSIK